MIIYDSTKDKNGQFQTGFTVNKSTKYITVRYLTNWQNQRDLTWKMSEDEFNQIPHDDYCGKCLYLYNFVEPTSCGGIIY